MNRVVVAHQLAALADDPSSVSWLFGQTLFPSDGCGLRAGQAESVNSTHMLVASPALCVFIGGSGGSTWWGGDMHFVWEYVCVNVGVRWRGESGNLHTEPSLSGGCR